MKAQKSGGGMNRLAESVGDGENGAGLNNEIHTMEGVRSEAEWWARCNDWPGGKDVVADDQSLPR
jgi:hypothetical protein